MNSFTYHFYLFSHECHLKHPLPTQDSIPGCTTLSIFVLPIQELIDENFYFNGSRSTKHQSNIAAQLPSNVPYDQYTRVQSEAKEKSLARKKARDKARRVARKEAKAKATKVSVASLNKKMKSKAKKSPAL